MTGMRKYLVALALLITVTGCSGSDAGSESAPSAPPSSATPVTTASQWASTLAGNDLDTAWSDAQDACGALLMDLTSPACGARLVALDFTAMALGNQFDELAAKGEPEAEVADLVAETRASLVDVVAATNAWHAPAEKCLMSDSARCSDLAIGVLSAMTTFPGDEWRPYL